jgi:hypothetical protein
MSHCRVEAETNEHLASQDRAEQQFRNHRSDSFLETHERVLSVEFTDVFETLTEHLWRITKVDGKDICTDSERELLANALYVACAVHYGEPADIVEDAKTCFQWSLEEHPAIYELVEREIERRF